MSGYFAGFGLRIASEIAIPGAQECEAGEPELTIVEGSARLAEIERALGPYQAGGDSLLFMAPGLARYRCDGGRSITVEAEPGSVQEDVAALLIATAIPACLWMRGEIVLHAATAVLPGEQAAIAFAGRSGSGKSRLLAGLLDAGAKVVGDDSVCLREEDGAVVAAGLPAVLQLRLTDCGAQRRELRVAPEHQLAACRLRALVVSVGSVGSGGSGGSRDGLTRLRGAAALRALLMNLHRPRVPQLLGMMPALLPRLAALASSLAIYSVYSLADLNDSNLSALTCGGE